MSAKTKSDCAPVVQIFAVLHADAADMERDCRLQAQAVEQKAADNTTKTKMAKMAAARMPRTSSMHTINDPAKPPAAVGSVEPLVADSNLKKSQQH